MGSGGNCHLPPDWTPPVCPFYHTPYLVLHYTSLPLFSLPALCLPATYHLPPVIGWEGRKEGGLPIFPIPMCGDPRTGGGGGGGREGLALPCPFSVASIYLLHPPHPLPSSLPATALAPCCVPLYFYVPFFLVFMPWLIGCQTPCPSVPSYPYHTPFFPSVPFLFLTLPWACNLPFPYPLGGDLLFTISSYLLLPRRMPACHALQMGGWGWLQFIPRRRAGPPAYTPCLPLYLLMPTCHHTYK